MTIRCLGCEYDLTGTAREGVCPECGAAAAESHRAAREGLRPPPCLAAILAQTTSFGTAAITAFTVARHATISSAGEFVFLGMFVAAIISPPIGVGLIAWHSRSRRAASIALLVASVLLAIVHAAVLIHAFVLANNPLATLGLLALPLIGFPVLVGAAIASHVILRRRP